MSNTKTINLTELIKPWHVARGSLNLSSLTTPAEPKLWNVKLYETIIWKYNLYETI